MTEDERVLLAQAAYDAYGKRTQWLNFQGNPMPAWDDLGDTIRGAWVAAAVEVARIVAADLAERARDWLRST